MGVASRKKIVAQFSIEQQTHSYIELYKKLISEYIPPCKKTSWENFQEGAEISFGKGLFKLATEYGSLKKEKNELLRCAEEQRDEILLLGRACTERLNAIHQLNAIKVSLEEKIDQLKNTSLVEQICDRIKKIVGLC